jgi:hypothetical protein
LISSAVGVIPILIEVPLILVAVVLALGAGLFTFTV